MHSTSAFKPPSASRTTRDETVHFPIYGYNSKEEVWATPQQPGLIEPNKPSEKRGLSKDEPDASQRFGQHSRFDWHSFPPGVHARLVLIFRLTSVWPSVPFRLVLAFRLALIQARCSCFARRPCSPDGHISSNDHARLVLMLHPILKGDRSGTYRARTSGTNPPWQESYSMHDFEAPDVK